MSETYEIAPDGTPERLIQRLENATPGNLFYCEADREEAVEIAQEEFATALSAAEARGRAAGLWRTMDSAPKDGTPILVCDDRLAGGFHQVVSWEPDPRAPGYSWATSDGIGFHESAFTHWMPPPEPPPLEVQYSEANHVEE
jgi:hypothetical protein